MTRLFISTCFIFFEIASFGQKNDTLLYLAYKKKSVTELQSFFENWASETQHISKENFSHLNDTAKNIYLVYQSLYDPRDINKTGGSEWGNDIYKAAKYFLIQDKMLYAVVDNLLNNISGDPVESESLAMKFPIADRYDTLRDFRPQLSFSDAKCVTLTKSYDSLLNHFLGNKYYKLGTGGIMSPARSKGESDKRRQFLENYIKIWYGHWGGYWQFHSYPYASRITFDKDFQNAVVDYRMVYEGGYAYLKKINCEWKLIKAERTWIE